MDSLNGINSVDELVKKSPMKGKHFQSGLKLRFLYSWCCHMVALLVEQYLKTIYIYSVDEQLRKIMEIHFSLIRGRVVNGPEFDSMTLGSICPEFESPC